jgi:hypothetical protein
MDSFVEEGAGPSYAVHCATRSQFCARSVAREKKVPLGKRDLDASFESIAR